MATADRSNRRRFTATVSAFALVLSLVLTVLVASPAAAEERPVLRLGSSGDAVLVLEERLVELGFGPGVVDGLFDGATRVAVVEFQGVAGIGRDGIVGPVTWSRLDAGVVAPEPDPDPPAPDPPVSGVRPVLRLGSSGDAVLVLEERLVELGFGPGVVDGLFDGATRVAVVEFQGVAGIGRDGIVGPVTWSRLDAGVVAPEPDPDPPAPDPPVSGVRPVLRLGSSGDAVLVLEQRLSELGYWLSGVDRTFSSTTYHAVVALQKAAGLSRDGIVGPNTWAVLDEGVRPVARSSSGHLIEVDKTRQLLLVVDNGRVTEIHSTSTGRSAGATPEGRFTVYRQIDGFRYAPLGTLYRPKYVYHGVAIHGYTSVPTYPASHGCLRLTYPAMDRIWASGVAPVGTPVWIYR